LAVPIEDIDYVQLHIAHIDIFLMVQLQTVVRAHLCKFDLSSKMPAKIQNLEPGIASAEDEEFIASEHNPRRISELSRPISAPAFTEVTQDMSLLVEQDESYAGASRKRRCGLLQRQS
jgi:hypothetical protein